MASPSLFVHLPAASRFRIPPNPIPEFIPPAQPGSFAYAPPISIPDRVYSAVLDPRVPLTIAAVYAVTAKLLNRYNRSTGRRPWAVSKTPFFFAFVVFHNVLLAVYSAWTWWGMLGTLRRSIANPFTNTGDSTTGGWPATVDSFCRLSGTPGLGNGLFYDEAADRWLIQSAPASLLASPGFSVQPDRAQPGRLWNEGLAFYGWIFYLSKFYEVVDTLIILAKGKFSSTLQTYHHAGAMLCMWAGMRYMSPPIWMFVFVNSGIHALMYTYYTITAFSIRVPTAIKRSLTTMQITQFLVGASYAMAHSFVSYTVPVSAPTAQTAGAAAPVAPASAGSSSVFATLKGFLSGLAAAPGAAASSSGATHGLVNNGTAARAGFVGASLRTVPCIVTTGETFAIWLNVLYLAPLTYLFVKFFITSYLRRSSAESARVARLGKKGAHNDNDDATANDASTARSDGYGRTGLSRSTTGPGGEHATLAAALATTEEEVRRRLSNVGNLAEKAGWDAARNLEQEVYGESGKADEVEAAADMPAPATPPANGRPKKAKARTSRHAT
ncbi:fatty acid elongase [Niveomyces insectorum RCEF 264]|uniref:Elongation of fatty acids protein n=1 Tax=Niveomyces insectorum RCEF 264 TaxID=1081102 RepID=A0A162MPY1_9HYPO|nr:fatty acid elongase [Niveomyces insectorum RCEF 264]